MTEVKVKESETFYTSLQKMVKNAKRFQSSRKVEQNKLVYTQESMEEIVSEQRNQARITIMLNCPYF